MAAATVEKIYDFKTIGVGSSISEVRKFNDELKKSVELKKQLNELFAKGGDLSQLKKYQTELANIEKAERARIVKMNASMQGALKLAKVNRELALEIKHVADEVTGSTDALNEHNKAEVKAIQEANKWAEAQKRSTVAGKQKTVSLNAEITTIANLTAENKKLRAERDKLDLSSESGVRKAKELNNAISENSRIIRENQDEVIKQKMNIGNYESALDKLWGGLRKIAYVIPGLGIAGIFNLAFEALIPLLPQMDFLNDKFKEFQTLLVEARKSANEESAELEHLYHITQDTTLSIDERTAAVHRLQDLFPAYFGNISTENILNGNAIGVYNNLKQSILDVAKATALKSKIIEIQNAGLDEQLKLEKKYNDALEDEAKNKGKVQLKQFGLGAGPLGESGIVELNDNYRYKVTEARAKDLENFRKQQNEKLKIYTDSYDRMLGFDLKEQQAKDQKDAAKELKEIEKAASKQSKIEKAKQREAEKAAKEQEAIGNINFQNRLNLMEDRAAEIAKREKQFQDEINVGADRKIAQESLDKDILEIKVKYHKQYMSELESQYLDESKIQKDIDDEKKRAASELAKDLDSIDQQREDLRILRYEEELAKEKKHTEDLKKEQENRKKAIEYFYSSSLDLAAQYFRNQSQLASQEADDRYQDVLKFQDGEKQKRLAQAQSAAEKEAIENEYKQKADKAERQRNIERQEIARKQLYIEWAVASLKALSTSNNIYDGLAKEAIVTGEFLLALQSLNSQKFEEGGSVPTSTGGDITGPSHAGGGVPFNFEAEGGEMAIINKRSTMDKGMYNITGTPRQIASAINELGGGKRFAPGAIGTKFEYGGLLGANLSAPVMSAPAYSGSSDISGVQSQILKAIQSQGNQIRNIRVTLNPHDVRNFNSQYNKNVQLAVV